jgi:hypothetical protein
MSLADFDPLTSPANAAGGGPSAAASSPSSAAATASSSFGSSSSSSPAKPKFDGNNLNYFFAAKWVSKSADAVAAAQTLTLEAPKARVADLEQDLTAKLLAEKAEHERLEREKALAAAAEEEKRQEDAKAAAAAGKEAIAEDANKVELPGPELLANAAAGGGAAAASNGSAAGTRPASASPVAPIDPAIAEAQAAQDKLHEAENRARNRYAEKATLHLISRGGDGQTTTEWIGAVALKDKSTLEVSDVSKVIRTLTPHDSANGAVAAGASQSQPPVREDVPGTFTLAVSADGKKVTGKLENQEVDFEVSHAETEPSNTQSQGQTTAATAAAAASLPKPKR